MSEAEVLAAVIARLELLGSTARSLGQLYPTTVARPEHYNQVVVSERPQFTRRVGGSTGVSLWRVSILSVGKRYGDAQNERRIARSLEDQTMVINGVETGAFALAVEHGAITPDEGWFSGSSEFVFAT